MTKEELKEYEKMVAQMDADAAAIKKQREEERNKVTSYSVMTTDKETGERVVQTYAGDDAAVAKKEADARKKKYGGNTDLTDLLTPKATKKTSTAAKTQAATKAKTSTAPKAEEKTSTAPVTTGDLKKQLTAKERAAAKAEGLYMEGDTATQNTTLSAKNLAEAEKTMLKNAAAARSEEKKAAKAEQKAAEIYFEDEANAEPYYIDKERKAMQAAADEAAKAFVKSGAGAPNLSVPTFAEKGVELERKAKAEAADAAMRAQKDEDLLGPEGIKRKTEAEAKAAKARQNQTLAQIDLAALESRRAALEKEIEKAGDLTTADIKAAQAAAGKGARYGESTTAAAYREQQEKIRALQAAMTELDGEIDRVKAARYYYSIPRRSDFEETAKKGKEQFYTGEALENDTEKLRYKELLDAGADPEIIEGGNGYFGGPMLNLYTEEEKKIYYYLYATDKEAAAEFWEIANRRVAEDQRDQKYQEVYELAKKDKTGILPRVFNVAAGTVSGIDEVGNLVDYTLEGKLRPKLGISGAVDASIEAVTEDMSDARKFLYGTGLSIANNVALVGTLGSLAGLPMALSAAAGATNDALARGATDEEALAFGVASGIAEAAFEKISIEKLITLRDSRTGRQLIRNAMIQGGIEASEEAMTSIANTVSDAMIMGDKAELINMVGAYIDQGYSDEEAEKLAFRDWWGNIGLDALGGFISGGVLGFGTVVLNRIENRLQTRSEADLSQINRAIEERAEQSEKGMTGAEVEKTGKAIQKILDGKLITETEDKAMMQSPAAQEVFAEITGTDYVSGERVARDILRDMTGVEAKAAQSDESLTEWDQRTAPKEKAPEAKATDALGELTGLKAGPTEINEDLAEWNRRTQEAKPKPSENWRQNVTKKKAAEIDEAVTMGERRGNKVVVTTEIPGEGRHDPDGTIYLNPSAEHPVRQVLVHEFTHDIETSKVYERFSKAVLDIAEKIDGADIAQMKEQIRLEEPGLNDPGIERELVARIAGSRLFSDQNMVNRLFNTDQTVFRKIKNWISDALTKAFGSDERKALLQAEKLYLRAMNSRGQVDGVGEGQNFIAYDNSDQPYWKIEDSKDIFKGITDVNSLKNAAFDFILHGYKGGENITDIIDGKPLEFRRVSANEFVYGRDSQELNERPYKQKMRMATSVIDLIDNAFIHYSAPDWKNHPKFSGEFENYQGRVGIDDNIFKYIVRIGKTKNGNVFYDINLEADGEVPGALRHVSFKKTSASEDIIFNPEEKVNTKIQQNSKGSSYEDMLEAQREKLQKNGAKTGVTMTVDDWVGMAKNLVETNIGTLEWKDPARALDKVAGRNRRIRNELYELIEKPIHESQGKYAANLKEKAKSMTDKFSELGIKAKSKESKAVQWIGEGQREIGKTGETEEYTLTDLQHDFPEKWQDIKAAADYCREVYDQYLKDLNDMYSEIYPATKEAAEDQVENYREAEKALRKKADNLREVEKRLTERIEEKRRSLSRMKEGNRNYADTENAILSLQRSLTSTREDIRRYDTMAFEKETRRKLLAAQIESGDILKNRQIKARKDYFRHFQDMSGQWQQLLDVFQNDQRISTGLIGVSENTKPKTMWTSIAQERANQNYYTEDAVTGIMEYATIAEKLLAFNPTINKLRSVSSTLRNAGELADMEKEGSGKSAGTVAQWVDNLANNLAGKTRGLDRYLTEALPGTQSRKILKAVNILNSRTKANAILGNIRSALVQVSNATNAASYIYNPITWGRGVVALSDSMRNKAGETAEARAQSSFMERRYMDDTISDIQKAIEKDGILQKPKEFALWMLGAGDRGAAELIWHTAYAQYLTDPKAANRYASRNYANAVDYADDITRRSVAGRGEGDIALMETSKITNLMAPFQIEVNNTWQNLKEQVGKKNAAGIVAFEIVTWALNGAFEALINDRPLAFDFLDAFGLTDWLKELLHIGDDDDDEEDKKTFGDRFKDAAGEFVSGLPMGTQVAQIVKDFTGGSMDLFGEKDPTKFGTGNMGITALGDVVKAGFDTKKTVERDWKNWWQGENLDSLRATGINVLDAVAPVAFPWGGKQVSRTVQGLDQILQGGNYGYNSEGERYLKYTQGESLLDSLLNGKKPTIKGAANDLKTLTLGRYGGEGGRKYLENGYKRLTPEKTSMFEEASKENIDKEAFYDFLLNSDLSKKTNTREALLADQRFTGGQKNRLDVILFPGDKEHREYQSKEAYIKSGLSEKDGKAFDEGVDPEDLGNWKKLFENMSGDGKTARFAGILSRSNYTDKQKQAILDAVTDKTDSVFTGDANRNEEFYKALGLSAKERDEARIITAISGNQEEQIEALKKAGYSEEKATEIVKANSWRTKEDSTAENYASTGLSDGDQYRLYNILQTTEGKEAQVTAIAEAFGVSEREAGDLRHKANGEWINSIDDIKEKKKYESRAKKISVFERFNFTEDEIVAGYNGICGMSKKADKIAALTEVFIERGDSPAAAKKKASNFYNIAQGNNGYK